MKMLLILLFAAVNLVIYGQETISNKLTTEHVSIAGTKVSLIPPAGFDKSVNFTGFQQNNNSSSIMIVEIPGPFSEIIKGFTKSGLKTQGVDLIDKRDLKIDNFPAVFIEAEQAAYGIPFTKYILTFGTDSNTTMINGMFPKELSEPMSAEILESILSVVYESNKDVYPFDEIEFKVDIENTKLKYANVIANAALYTVDGKVPTESADKTFYSIARSLGEIEIIDKKQYAIDRFKKIASVTDINPEKITDIEINGFSGYEIIAQGTNNKTGSAEQIYFVMLFNHNLYYLLIGVAEDNFENNIELFNKVTNTFRLK